MSDEVEMNIEQQRHYVRSSEMADTSTPANQGESGTQESSEQLVTQGQVVEEGPQAEQPSFAPQPVSGAGSEEEQTYETPEEETRTTWGPFMTPAELSELGRHPIPFLVHDLIPARGLTVIGGDAKAGKTTHAVNIALEVSVGGTVYDHHRCLAGTVMYLNLEVGDNAFGERYNELCTGKGMDPAHNPNLVVSHDDYSLDLGDEDSMGELERHIADQRPAMLIIDNLGACGDFDEGRGRTVRRIYHALREMSYRQNTSIVLIDHHGRLGKGVVGHNAKLAVPEVTLGVHSLGNGRNIIRVANNRERGNAGLSYECQLNIVDGVATLDVVPDDQRTASKWWTGHVAVTPNAKQIILGMLSHDHWTRRTPNIELECRRHGIMPKAMTTALLELEASGQIERINDPDQTGRANRAFVYRLAAPKA